MKYMLETKCGDAVMASIIELIDLKNTVELRYEQGDILLSAEDSYPFFALTKIRAELEKMNCLLICNGSRLDVYPSGMSSVGLLAYELVVGQKATKTVNIFDGCENISLISTVNQQKAYFDEWVRFFRKIKK